MSRKQQLKMEQLESRMVLSTANGAGSLAFDNYIVMFEDGLADHISETANVVSAHAGQLTRQYNHAIKGFAARLPEAAAAALARNPNIASVERDSEVTLLSLAQSTGVDRIDADQNVTSSINGTPDENWTVNVVTIDSGVDIDHPDLNVAGGWNFVRGADDENFNDGNGHGTHVAGTIGALDDDNGVVGVAPGIDVWAARILGNNGSGKTSDFLAALDRVAGSRTDSDPTNDIAAINLSLSGGSNSGIEAAFETLANLGVISVAAAGNNGADGLSYPGSDPHAMAVAAFADSDGTAGGIGPATSAGDDDTLADFSNYGCSTFRGTCVEIAAPGVDILSSWKGGGYKVLNGTSMATPHVTAMTTLLIQEYSGSWHGGAAIPQDMLDVELVRKTIVATAQRNADVNGDFVDTPSGGTLPVVDASGGNSWVTVPVAEIQSPADGLVASGVVMIEVEARDLDTISPEEVFSVSVRIDDTYDLAAAYDVDTGKYVVQWDTLDSSLPTYGDGTHQLHVIAVDADGNSSEAGARLANDTVSVTVDNVDEIPSIEIVNPIDGSTVGGTVLLKANASDDRNVTSVVFSILEIPGSEMPATESSEGVWTVNWDTQSGQFPDDAYTIVATVTDDASPTPQQSMDSVSVSVRNDSNPSSTLHISDLDGSVDANRKATKWTAYVTILVTDNVGNAVANATVTGDFSYVENTYGGLDTGVSGVTDANGLVTIKMRNIVSNPALNAKVRFTVTNVSHASLDYLASANWDPDGDSDGTSIVIENNWANG